MDDVKPANQHSGYVDDWTVWHMLDEDTAVVVITDIVITESVVAAAVVRKGTAVNGLMSSKGTSLLSTLLQVSWASDDLA